MTTLRTLKISILILALLVAHSTGIAQTAYSPETLKKIKEVENSISGSLLINDERPVSIAERMKKYNVQGLSIAVIHNHKIVWAKGYGWADVGEKRPVTPETLFEPGSISKSLNALGILKLAQDKKLDLYTDINSYLQSWKFPYDSLSNGKVITIAQLLSHSAGLSTHGFPGHEINGPTPTLIEVLDGKAPAVTPAVRSMFEPGLKFQYSGGGTSISQMILTDIVKQPYDKWMDDNILRPIGMTSSTFAQPPAEARRSECASAYNQDGSPIAGKFHVYPEQAAAGLWMTPSDLCRYIIAMQNTYQGKASTVLNSDMIKLHLTPYNNENAAMGTFIDDMNGTKYFQHGAGNDGFCGQFYGSLEGGDGVAIFVNSENGRILSEVINSVAKAYHWKNFYREPQRKKSITVDEMTIQSYFGIYLYDDSWSAVGKSDSDYHFYTNGTHAKMYFTSQTSFFNEEFPAVKEFMKDKKGNIVGYSRKVDGKDFPKATKVMNPDTVTLPNQTFGEIGWYFIETKQFKDALRYYRRAVELYPEDLNMHINSAHMYLFTNEYAKAFDIYKAHLNDSVRPGLSWIDLLRGDYTFFKENKYDMTMLDKVFTELQLEKPKGK